MFVGHNLKKLVNDNWVFDFTEYIGYKVELDKQGKVKEYTEAFRVIVIDDKIDFIKSISVPLKILKEAQKQVEIYQNDINMVGVTNANERVE